MSSLIYLNNRKNGKIPKTGIISIIVPAISITTTSSLDNTKDTTNIYLYDIVGGISLVGGSITTFTIMSLLVPCLIILCAVGVIFDNKVIKFVLATIALVLVIYFAILYNRCQDLVDKDSTSETLSLAGIIMLTVSLTLDLLGYVIIEYFDKTHLWDLTTESLGNNL